jgi:hypothetical protein
MRAVLAAAVVAAALAVPGGALADDMPPPAPPAAAQLALAAAGTLRDGARTVALPGRGFRVTGALRPYAPGQRVRVTLLRDGRPVRHLHPRLVAQGSAARFTIAVRRRTPGTYAVRAVHRRSAELAYARSSTVRVKVVDTHMGWGHGGAAVRLLQAGLRRLHYAAPRSGVYDAATGRAVMAWRKVAHRARLYTADRGVLYGVLDGKGAWRVRHPRDGHHVEADISLQALALVDGSRVVRIEHMSSGKPSTPTVLGRYRVYRKQPGTNAHGMVDSSYFIRGYAIHGYASVPTYNASHGCLRVPVPDARAIYDWVRLGDVVWVEP